jgi:hypothetical protein
MIELTKKHKTHSLTIYHRGIELEMLCVTTSKKKFAELIDKPVGHINGYAYAYDLRYPICNENPDVLFAKPGRGGEAMMIFDKNEVKTLEEYEHLIDEHRKVYSNYRDYQEKTGRN